MPRLLLISYYFPPCGGAAVQRWLRLLSEIESIAWEATVIAPHDGMWMLRDDTLLPKLPAQIKVLRNGVHHGLHLWKLIRPQKSIPQGELDSLVSGSFIDRLLLWIRLNLIIPDLRKNWNKAALRCAIAELRSNDYDVIISTGPPHSTHLVGKALAQRTKVAWVADFRDPWTKIHYLQNTKPMYLSRAIHSFLERMIVSTADLTLSVSQSIVNELPAGNKAVLYNGYNQKDFEGITYLQTHVFRIRYIGQITTGQDLSPFIQLLVSSFANAKIELEFIGTKLPNDVAKQIPHLPLKIHTTSLLSHQEALTRMVNSEMLLLIINDAKFNMGIITTKLFEYIGSKTPILCIGNPACEAAMIIAKYNAGLCLDYNDQSGWKDFIANQYEHWQQGRYTKNTFDTSPLSTQVQIHELKHYLEMICSKR